MKDDLRILLSCTSGITTSYFAYLLENAINKCNHNVIVDAVSYTDLDNVQSRYDFIFLAPQISYQYAQMREKYGNKVFMIDSYDFATGNVEHVIQELIEEENER